MVIQRVLCPVDFSEFSRRALHHAEAIAKWYEAELHVVEVLQAVMPSAVPALAAVPAAATSDIPAATGSALEAFVERACVRVPTRQVVREGDPVKAIVAYAAEIEADLIVIGTHGRSGFDRALNGSTAEGVLHRAACPVLTIPRGCDQPGSAERVRFTHVLCAVDFSRSSIRALEQGLSLAQENRAKVTLLHVLETLSEEEARSQAHFRVGEYVAKRKQETLEQLESLIPADARAWCDISAIVQLGQPARVILREADARNVDLIAAGSQGHDGLGLMFLGSTTQAVVRHAVCPVLTARPSTAQP